VVLPPRRRARSQHADDRDEQIAKRGQLWGDDRENNHPDVKSDARRRRDQDRVDLSRSSEFDVRVDDRDQRLVALYKAKKEGDTDRLLAFLSDPDHRRTAAGALGESGDRRAVEPLRALLTASDALTRSNAATALADLGDTLALPTLEQMAIEDENEVARAWAVEAVGRLGSGEELLKFLLSRLDDPHVKVRHAAALSLGRLGRPDAVGPLKRAKANESWRRRKVYKVALARIAASLPDSPAT
jgi:HEAT repeat protein